MTIQPTPFDAIAERFREPHANEYGPVPIWWWSGAKVTRERLRWQMEQLTSQGVAQAVIMNLAPSGPLYGSLADDPAFMSEEWWELFLGACEDAAELGFRFWPYDQLGFSGANFQGRLVTKKPHWAGRTLGRLVVDIEPGRTTEVAFPQDSEPLAAYVVSTDGGSAEAVEIVDGRARWSGTGQTLTIVFAQEHGFDYFNPEAVAGLLDTIHGEFERRASQWFGSVIVGFFQDELPSMPTWGDDFAASFEAAHGFAIEPRLGALWGDPTPGDGHPLSDDEVRLRYERHRASKSRAAFFGQLDAWLAKNGLQCGFDQQSPAREGDPVGSVGVYADYLDTHNGFSAPGSDHLGDPKVHSSLSHLSGGSRTWIEAFHSSGWGGTLEETYDWLAPFLKRGATLYDPHAVYYATPGGWWEWAPPSTCWRQPYWPEYHVLSGAVARLSEALSFGTLVADTALIFPTTTVQAGFTFGSPTTAAADATRVYHELNGETAWSAERPGVLDRAAHEYEIVNDGLLDGARVDAAGLHVGPATFRNVVLPAVDVLDDAAAGALADLVDAGGRVIAVESSPRWFVEPGEGAERFSRHVASGAIAVAADSSRVPEFLERASVWAEADVPVLLRQVEGGYLLALFAHDDVTGTEQPIFKGSEGYLDWIEVSWNSFWEGLRADGYTFVPVGGRTTRVRIHGVGGAQLQRWNPVTGERFSLAPHIADDGSVSVDVDFRDGSVTLLAVGDDLPDADGTALDWDDSGVAVDIVDWQVESESSLDNRFGDFGSADRGGVLPQEIWEFDTATGETPTQWSPVVATFGPYARIAGPATSPDFSDDDWREAEWSLSRGIRNDGSHMESLGPKGYVPDEVLLWKDVRAGQFVAATTWIEVASDSRSLVVGANARTTVSIDGAIAERDPSNGYWTTVPVDAGRHRIDLGFEAEYDEDLRATFAVVADVEAFRRAEWVVPVDGSLSASTLTVELEFDINELPADGRVQVGAEQPCTIVINGVDIGRQNAFHPYGGHREARFHPYDLAPHLHPGRNRLELRSTDPGREPAVVVDSAPTALGGLGIMTGVGEWTAVRDGTPVDLRLRSRQWGAPRFLCLVARPHPLPRSAWLERPAFGGSIVDDVIPDLDPDDDAPRWLRAALPTGTRSIEVPTRLAFEAFLDGSTLGSDHVIVFDPPTETGAIFELRFDVTDGRRGGALLDEPARVETQRVAADLRDWSELGFDALAGEVRYFATVSAFDPSDGAVVLDLGDVRGSASVHLDGEKVAEFAWGPYSVDLTDRLAGGDHELEVRVHNTLASYLDVASPTPGVFPGQKRAGLFGPVRLVAKRVRRS
ncbi:hypothetical protein [Lacisediminihabitans changchengi]|uniref:Glycoside hydrolase n=1 Tax=Lacisediminihabitans changchengi TaxID=2787634 RepID=A0A934SI70_9MICO|nr:hypothetical protein [Lacisediminihabitans changchengi]MBK4347106.1 hypothetical protein [Lacisediminihabitans changchengi]